MQESAAPAAAVRQAHAADILIGEGAAPKKHGSEADSAAAKVPAQKPPAVQQKAHASDKSAHTGEKGGKPKEATTERKSLKKKKKKPKVVAAQEEEPVQAKPKVRTHSRNPQACTPQRVPMGKRLVRLESQRGRLNCTGSGRDARGCRTHCELQD